MNTQVEGLLALFPDVKKGEGCNGADYGADFVITGDWEVSPESMDERLKMRCDVENVGDGVLYYTNADGSRGAYTDITYTNEDFFAIDFMDKHKNEKFSECCLYIKELAKVNNWFEMLASFKVNEKGQIIYDKFGTAEDAAEFFRNQYSEKGNRFYDGWNKEFIYDDTIDEWFRRGISYVEDLEKATSKLNHEKSLNAIATYIGQKLHDDLRDKCLKVLQDRIEKIRKSKPTLEKMKGDYISAFITEIKPKKESEDYIFNLTETEENGRLALKGEYYNDGYVVVSDGHILYASKNRYEVKKEGKIFDKSGKEIDAKYPNWKSVFPSILKKIEIDAQKLLDFTNRHIKVVKYRGFKIIDYIKIEGAGSYKPDLLKKLLTVSLFEKDVEFYISKGLMLCFKATNGSHGLLMPTTDGGGLAIGSYRIDYDYNHFIKNAYYVQDEEKHSSKKNGKNESKDENIYGYYRTECDKDGDILVAREDVERAGGIYDDYSWDKEDETVTIKFHCKSKELFENVCDRLGIVHRDTQKSITKDAIGKSYVGNHEKELQKFFREVRDLTGGSYKVAKVEIKGDKNIIDLIVKCFYNGSRWTFSVGTDGQMDVFYEGKVYMGDDFYTRELSEYIDRNMNKFEKQNNRSDDNNLDLKIRIAKAKAKAMLMLHKYNG